jgi:hypothetical protein
MRQESHINQVVCDGANDRTQTTIISGQESYSDGIRIKEESVARIEQEWDRSPIVGVLKSL